MLEKCIGKFKIWGYKGPKQKHCTPPNLKTLVCRCVSKQCVGARLRPHRHGQTCATRGLRRQSAATQTYIQSGKSLFYLAPMHIKARENIAGHDFVKGNYSVPFKFGVY